jgi:serine/threonine protein kinase
VLYELLTGKPPLETAAPVRELAPEVPRDLEDVVMRCLARNPSYRPTDLESELAPGTVQLPRPRPTPEPRRRKLWLGLAAAAALAVAAILLAVTLTGGKSSAPPPPARRAVPQIPRGADAQAQARNIAAWLRRYSGR